MVDTGLGVCLVGNELCVILHILWSRDSTCPVTCPETVTPAVPQGQLPLHLLQQAAQMQQAASMQPLSAPEQGGAVSMGMPQQPAWGAGGAMLQVGSPFLSVTNVHSIRMMLRTSAGRTELLQFKDGGRSAHWLCMDTLSAVQASEQAN